MKPGVTLNEVNNAAEILLADELESEFWLAVILLLGTSHACVDTSTFYVVIISQPTRILCSQVRSHVIEVLKSCLHHFTWLGGSGHGFCSVLFCSVLTQFMFRQ